jgi:hypothetical protein
MGYCPWLANPWSRHCEERSDEPHQLIELKWFFGQFHSRLHRFVSHFGFPQWLGMTRF